MGKQTIFAMSGIVKGVVISVAALLLLWFILRVIAQLFLFPAGPHKFGRIAELHPHCTIVRRRGLRYVICRQLHEIKRIVVYFHGNAGTVDDRLDFGLELANKAKPKTMVVMPEYPGYGGEVRLIDQETVVENACRVLEDVAATASNSKVPVIVVGRSLGSAVATAVAARCPSYVDRLLLISPFPSVTEVAQNLVPGVPQTLLELVLPARFDVEKHARAVSCPVDAIAAEDDHIVPIRLSERQFQNFPNRQHFTTIQSPAGHNNMQFIEPKRFLDAFFSTIRNCKQ
jgi:pimeloyl-ACP methyl ester carboxylesterase